MLTNGVAALCPQTQEGGGLVLQPVNETRGGGGGFTNNNIASFMMPEPGTS